MKCDSHAQHVALIDPFQPAPLSSLGNPQSSPSASESSACSWSQSSSPPSSQRSEGTCSSSAPSINCDDTPYDTWPHRALRPAIPPCVRGPLSNLCEIVAKPTLRQCLRRPFPQQLHVQVPVPAALRRNPRRTCHSATSRTGQPPSLVRQVDRKVNFVDNLVGKAKALVMAMTGFECAYSTILPSDSSTLIVEAIWPTSSVACRAESGSQGVLPLRTFIQETLRRSRTSYSTLQVALYYLILIKPNVVGHDFTMEQQFDCAASRAVQCGRRMFLAALILASKYLQDRNYSTRAWSKISGLNPCEINQNEIAFLLAVNWKLHISDALYNRWTDCVMRYTPSLPPSPGGAGQLLYDRQVDEFRAIIIKLNPDLDKIDDLAPLSPVPSLSPSSSSVSDGEAPLRSLFTPPSDPSGAFGYDGDCLLPSKSLGGPVPMEPSPTTSMCTPDRFAPALGLLPTPRLTPQPCNISTPAVSAMHCHLTKMSMGYAWAKASCAGAAQTLDRWPASSQTSSPLSYVARRSSLATIVSTASSPESMISDNSRSSRSSSISSASSLASAPAPKLDVQARCRYAMQCSDKISMRPTIIASVPEDCEPESGLMASPDSYTGPVGKELCNLSLETLLGRAQIQREMDEAAARALQEMRRQDSPEWPRSTPVVTTPRASGLKRCRSMSTDKASLQDNVRELLGRGNTGADAGWLDNMVRVPLRRSGSSSILQVPVRATVAGSHKRLCCSSETVEARFSTSHPIMGGPGMWRDYHQS